MCTVACACATSLGGCGREQSISEEDSESEPELMADYHFRNGTPMRSNGHQNGSCNSIDSAGALGGHLSSTPGSRPITPTLISLPILCHLKARVCFNPEMEAESI